MAKVSQFDDDYPSHIPFCTDAETPKRIRQSMSSFAQSHGHITGGGEGTCSFGRHVLKFDYRNGVFYERVVPTLAKASAKT